MKHFILGILSFILFVSLIGCSTPQKSRYYIETKVTSLQCPVGSIYRADGWCYYPTYGWVARAVKKHKKIAKINCKQILRDINQCSRGN